MGSLRKANLLDRVLVNRVWNDKKVMLDEAELFDRLEVSRIRDRQRRGRGSQGIERP